MTVTTTFYDTAHQYGLDNMTVTPSLTSSMSGIIGYEIKSVNSWGIGNPKVGQPSTITTYLSGGFTLEINFTYTTSSSGVVTNVNYFRTNTGELLISQSGSTEFTSSNYSTVLQNERMYAGNDTVNGNSYNNALKGYTGNDRIDGGGGTDTAYFTGLKSQSQIIKSGNSIGVVGINGNDTLINVERLQFDDKAIAFDTNGNAGQAYRLYQAAFNRTPDQSGLGFQMNALDTGATLTNVAQNFINSPEFSATYGNLSDAQFVTQLYQNVLHRGPDAGGLSFHTSNLSAGMSRAQTLVGFSESPENQAALIGVIQNGMEYIPVS